jgi:hypothetical protein
MAFGIAGDNLQGTIGTAVIGNDVLPVLICLGQYTFYTLLEILFTVIDRGNYANQWWWIGAHT